MWMAKLKLIEENVYWYVGNISIRKDFSNKSLRAQTTKPKAKAFNYIKTKNYCSTNETLDKVNRDRLGGRTKNQYLEC